MGRSNARSGPSQLQRPSHTQRTRSGRVQETPEEEEEEESNDDNDNDNERGVAMDVDDDADLVLIELECVYL